MLLASLLALPLAALEEQGTLNSFLETGQEEYVIRCHLWD